MKNLNKTAEQLKSALEVLSAAENNADVNVRSFYHQTLNPTDTREMHHEERISAELGKAKECLYIAQYAIARARGILELLELADPDFWDNYC